jgi:pimeloyl-ACP methyl ester carboxylesterase
MSIDLLWHGFSSKPPFRDGNWLAQFTEQLIDLMDAEGIEKAHLEGESLGGWICLDMAIRHPERIGKLILTTVWGMNLEPNAVQERAADLEALRERSIQAVQNPSRDAIRKRMEHLMFSPESVTDELVDLRRRIWSRPETRKALTEYYQALFREETNAYLFGEDDLRRISAPALVLWTDRNPFQGVDAARRLAEVIPGAKLYLMKNAAHWPQWEHPEEHDEAVVKFLQSQRT